MPLSFGPILGGQILVGDDQYNQVYAIKNDGTVTYNPLGSPTRAVFSGAEGVFVVPRFRAPTARDRAFFQASAANDGITSYPHNDFTGLGGNILIPTEAGSQAPFAGTSMCLAKPISLLSSMAPPS